MKINYYLQENTLPNGDNAYRARVKYSRVLTLDDIIDEMNLPLSGVTKVMIKAMLESMLFPARSNIFLG